MFKFLYGDGAPLQIKYKEILDGIKIDNPNIKEKYFDFSLEEFDEFIKEVSQDSLFGDKKILIIKRFEKFKNKIDFFKNLKNYSINNKEILVIYEEIINEYGKREDETDKTSENIKKKLIETCESFGEVFCERIENQKKILEQYIEAELNISKIEIEELLNIIGSEFFKVKNEVEKIKLFLGEEKYSIQKINGIIIKSDEYNLKNSITQMLEKKEIENVLKTLEVDKKYYFFLSVIFEELLILLKLRLLIENGIIDNKINYNNFKIEYEKIKKYFINSKRNTPFHPYQVFLKVSIASNYNSKFLKNKIKELSLIEYRGKIGIIPENISIPTYVLNFFISNLGSGN
jgi:DNA polymerase-3 subunit delta